MWHMPVARDAPSSLTPHSSLHTPPSLTTRSALLATHSTLLTPHSSLLTPHSALHTPHSSFLTPHTSPPPAQSASPPTRAQARRAELGIDLQREMLPVIRSQLQSASAAEADAYEQALIAALPAGKYLLWPLLTMATTYYGHYLP